MEPTSRRSRSRVSPYKKRLSDRSGFEYNQIEMVRDKGLLVGPDEFDSPPPNVQPIGGEGDISPGFVNPFYLSYTSNTVLVQTYYLTGLTSIPFLTGYDSDGEIDTVDQWILVSGSNTAVTVSATPQVSAGQQNNQYTIQCVGSAVTLQNGNGLSLRSIYKMNSGDILNLFYSQTDNLWHETSRGNEFGFPNSF